jgi:hypothetical protein
LVIAHGEDVTLGALVAGVEPDSGELLTDDGADRETHNRRAA